TSKLHSLSVRIRIVGQPLRLPTAAMAGGPPALQIFDNFANQSRPAINESGIKLNKLRASLKFLPRRFRIANSTRSDHRNCGFCNNVAQPRRVWGADIQGDVIGKIAKQSKGIKVIVSSLFERRCTGFSNVDADWNCRPSPAFAQFAQPFRDDIRAVVVETEAIN